VQGRLTIADNCLAVKVPGVGLMLPIFPYSMGIWDDAKQTFTHNGKVISIGDPIRIVGGTIPSPAHYFKGTTKYDVPDCGLGFFLVDGLG
jgi:hypothetical protein